MAMKLISLRNAVCNPGVVIEDGSLVDSDGSTILCDKKLEIVDSDGSTYFIPLYDTEA